jgi:acyl-homoserine lactone acylase PvdQ
MLSARLCRHLVRAVIVAAIAAPSILAPLDAARPLAEQVVIRRDTFGVPHIVAPSGLPPTPRTHFA